MYMYLYTHHTHIMDRDEYWWLMWEQAIFGVEKVEKKSVSLAETGGVVS